jgi:hypothetical protein
VIGFELIRLGAKPHTSFQLTASYGHFRPLRHRIRRLSIHALGQKRSGSDDKRPAFAAHDEPDRHDAPAQTRFNDG